MKDPDCGYCARGELLDAFGIVICAERQHADSLQGAEPSRTLHRRVQGSRQRDRQPHRRGRNAFMADVARAAKAIHAAFHPDKLNYGAYGDTGCHLRPSRAEIQRRL